MVLCHKLTVKCYSISHLIKREKPCVLFGFCEYQHRASYLSEGKDVPVERPFFMVLEFKDSLRGIWNLWISERIVS